MEILGTTYLVISALSFIISIIILIRWWGMTSDVKDIKNILKEKLKYTINSSENESSVIEDSFVEKNLNTELIDKLISTMKQNQCIVRVKANDMLEIWDKNAWEDHLTQGKGKFFELVHKNY